MKKLRFIQTGDLHVGRGRETWGEAIALGRADRLFTALERVAEEHKCHGYVIAGDIFDHVSVRNGEREVVVSSLMRMAHERFVVGIAGNHDQYATGRANTDFLAALSESGEVPNFVFARADRPREWEVRPGLSFLAASAPLSENQQAVEDLVDGLEPDRRYVFVGHAMLKGSVLNERGRTENEDKAHARTLSLAKAGASPQVLWWAYGDIHVRQRLPTLPEGANGWYAGSPLQTSFGESPDRGVLVVTLAQDEEGAPWRFSGKKFVSLQGAGFEPLVRIASLEDLETAEPGSLLSIAAGLKIPASMRARIVSEYRVVEDHSPSVEVDAADIVPLTVFDPLMSSREEVREHVLQDFTGSDAARAIAHEAIDAAIQVFSDRTFKS